MIIVLAEKRSLKKFRRMPGRIAEERTATLLIIDVWVFGRTRELRANKVEENSKNNGCDVNSIAKCHGMGPVCQQQCKHIANA